MPLNDLRAEPMMAHLIATLDQGHSIGHYGRLVFTMIARHFIEPEELITHLEKDPGVRPVPGRIAGTTSGVSRLQPAKAGAYP